MSTTGPVLIFSDILILLFKPGDEVSQEEADKDDVDAATNVGQLYREVFVGAGDTHLRGIGEGGSAEAAAGLLSKACATAAASVARLKSST